MTDLLVRSGLSVILVGLAFYDWKRQQVPNVVVMPLLLTALPLTALRVAAGAESWEQVGLAALTWAVCFFMQATHMLGGGDAKLAMALVGLLPEPVLIYLLLVVMLVGHMIIVLGRDGWAGIQRVRGIVVAVVVAGQWPTQKEMRMAMLAHKRPVIYLISLAGLIFLWLI